MNPKTTSTYTINTTSGAYHIAGGASSSPVWGTVSDKIHFEEGLTFTKEEFAKVLGKMAILVPPFGLDLQNPAVQGAFAEWQIAVNKLAQAHENLELIANLAQDHE